MLKDNAAVNSILAQVPHVEVAQSDLSATYEIALNDRNHDHWPLYEAFRAIALSFRRVVELTTGAPKT